MRINVQLIDAETGNHLWGERFDKEVADLFDMQDEIGARLANQLGTELVMVEARRAARAPHPVSMDLYFQGMEYLNRGSDPASLSRARPFFEQALRLDAANVEAMVGMTTVDIMRATSMPIDRTAPLRVVEASLAELLAHTPNHARAHCLMGVVQIFTKRAAQGIAECERALALDRNLATAHAWIGQGKCNLGRAEETQAHVMEAFRLSPRDNKASSWMNTAGVAQSYLGADEAAVHWFKRSIETNREHCPICPFLSCRRAGSPPSDRGIKSLYTSWAHPCPGVQYRSIPRQFANGSPDLSRAANSHRRRPAQGRTSREMHGEWAIRSDLSDVRLWH
jgi:hypothetical protein